MALQTRADLVGGAAEQFRGRLGGIGVERTLLYEAEGELVYN